MYNHQLDTFLSVCQHHSFTMAAKAGFITPSAVVQQINLLEKQLGVKLFLRTHHGILLTPAGELLQKEAPELIRHAKEMTERIQKAADHRPIRLGWTTGVEDPQFISQCLAHRDTHEGVDIHLTRISGGVFEGLAQREFDLCQYADSPLIRPYGYTFTPLYTARQCIVLPPQHPLEGHAVLSLEDLCGEELLLLAPGIMSDHDAFRQLVAGSGLPIRLIEVENYSFETRTLCYSRKLPFLGMEPLSRQYVPLRCIPVSWNIPIRIGLISLTPAWDDLALLVREIQRSYVTA